MLGYAQHCLQAKGGVMFSLSSSISPWPKQSYIREVITGELENLQNWQKKICRRGRGRCKELECETKD